MTFAYPWMLLLLLIPVALLVREWKGRGQRVVLPFDHARRRGGRWLSFTMRLAQSFTPLLLAAAVLILAGPRELAEPRSKRVITNIEFCLDVSGSMTAQFGDGTRSDAAIQAINDFITYRKGDAFGLTIFGSSVLHWIPLTSDPSAFKCSPPFLRPEKLPIWFGGGTMIGMGLNACLKVLAAREEGDRMIILVSDGWSFDLYDGQDEAIARKLRENNVVVYTVHCAEDAPPTQLHTIADITGGHVFAAGDPQALREVMKRIDKMRQTRLEKTLPESQDFHKPFSIAGLSLLGVAVLALFGLRYTPW
jgi:Ca-activated chloride channel family protein